MTAVEDVDGNNHGIDSAMVREVMNFSELDISEYTFDYHEKTVLQSYLSIGKRYLMQIFDPEAKEEAERLEKYRELIALSKGKRGVQKHHEKHDVFTVADVTEYYSDPEHAVSKDQMKALKEGVWKMAPSRFFITLDLIVSKIQKSAEHDTYSRYARYSQSHLTMEILRAARRLEVRGFATLFPGTPRFRKDSLSINIPKVRSAIQFLLDSVEVRKPVPSQETSKLYNVQISPDTPPFIPEGTSEETLELVVDSEVEDRLRSVENICPNYDSMFPITSLENLSDDQRFVLERIQSSRSCVNLQSILDTALRSPKGKTFSRKTLYMRMYRACKNLESKGITSIYKEDGLVWVDLNRHNFVSMVKKSATQQGALGDGKTDLIKGYCEIPTDVISPIVVKKLPRDPYAIPKNCGSLRKSAINFEQGVKMLDYEENTKDRVEKRHSRGPYADMKFLMARFSIYQDESLRKIISLLNTITGEVIGFDYSTRFNDFAKGIIRLKKYERAQDLSLEQFQECVFVTLTTDPNRFPNLWKANRHSPIAWNTFMQILTVELGERKRRPKYIAAFEYTKTGLLHIHALIFGRRFLNSANKYAERDWISDKWNLSCGQGKIVEAYGLKNVTCDDGHHEWQWYRREDHPHDAEGMSGGQYLKKYLKKCMMAITDRYQDPASTLAPYWVENKRFWSCSRSLMPEGEPETSGSVPFEFLSIGYGMNVYEAEDMGLIDRIAYRRYDPDEYDPPDAAEGLS